LLRLTIRTFNKIKTKMENIFTLPKYPKGAIEKEVYLSNGLVFESIDIAMILTNSKSVTAVTVPIETETVNVKFYAHYSQTDESIWYDFDITGDHKHIDPSNLGFIDFVIECSSSDYKLKSDVQLNFKYEDLSEDFKEFIHGVFVENQDDLEANWRDNHADYMHEQRRLSEL